VFEYVVIDEFHHAAAQSYRLLLDYVQPQVLLGLTATPERHDGLDILHWFQGESTAEIRLPDAIYRKLLSPFHYFGIADSVDLRNVPWVGGRYSEEAISQAYCGNRIRADLILQKIGEYVLAPLRMRALGFCASVEHANFMAKYCNDHGLPAISLSGSSPGEVRQSAQEKLRRREVNILFVVDLYNEGVDIPEIDTVLFLRPTESLTVYLQQMGRGLRLHPEKDSLTVLDFIGAHRKEFRFASRIYALTGNALTSAAHQVEAGMPSLPAGCAFNLERVALERVLNNIREATPATRAALLQRLRAIASAANRVPTLAEGLSVLGYSLAKLCSKGTWSQLLCEAGLRGESPNPDEAQLSKGFARLSHIDDPVLIKLMLAILENGQTAESMGEPDRRRLMMVMASLWMSDGAEMTLEAALDRLRRNQAACSDLLEILRYRLRHSEVRESATSHASDATLSLYASYTRDEILMAIGHWNMQQRPSFREGTLHLAAPKIDAFFVTLNKSLEGYSPTTMYEDYIINDKLFHWQTPSTVSDTSPTAQRYINHVSRGYTPLLFVRDAKGGPDGTLPYVFFGSVTYQSHQGSRPVSVVWKLQERLPARLQRWIRT
jgi:hypothetical protein